MVVSIKDDTYINGMKLLKIKDKSFQSIMLYFYIKVGSKYEPLHILGISHFLEHLLFKGTEKYKTYKDINKLLDSNGIDFNAYTDKNVTAYHFKYLAKRKKTELITDIAYQMIFKSLITQKDLNIERNVIMQEYNDALDDPEDLVNEFVEKLAFKGHVLEHNVIGNKKTINSINRKDVLHFYKKFYIPKNVLITICGNFNDNDIDLLEKNFIKSKKVPSIYKVPLKLFPFYEKRVKFMFKNKNNKFEIIDDKLKEYTTKNVKCYNKKTEQNHLVLLFNTIGLYDDKEHIYMLLANILGGNMSSKLFTKIREELGLAYTINASVTNYEEQGYFEISTKTKPEDTIKCLHEILKLLKTFINKLTLEDIEQNKTNYNEIFESEFDDLLFLSEFYGEQMLFLNCYETKKDYVKKINKIKKEDINIIVNKLFYPDNLKILCYGIIKDKDVCEEFKKYTNYFKC